VFTVTAVERAGPGHSVLLWCERLCQDRAPRRKVRCGRVAGTKIGYWSLLTLEKDDRCESRIPSMTALLGLVRSQAISIGTSSRNSCAKPRHSMAGQGKVVWRGWQGSLAASWVGQASAGC
jgi:hypothetical protein